MDSFSWGSEASNQLGRAQYWILTPPKPGIDCSATCQYWTGTKKTQPAAELAQGHNHPLLGFCGGGCRGERTVTVVSSSEKSPSCRLSRRNSHSYVDWGCQLVLVAERWQSGS